MREKNVNKKDFEFKNDEFNVIVSSKEGISYISINHSDGSIKNEFKIINDTIQDIKAYDNKIYLLGLNLYAYDLSGSKLWEVREINYDSL